MVSELMKARRVPLDKLNQKKTTMEWQRDQYRDVNIKLVDFRNNKLFNYGLTSSISAKQATVSGNTSAVSAKTTANAVAGTMTVEVSSLATAAYLRSGAGTTDGIGAVDSTKSLSALKAAGQINYTADASGNVSFDVTNNGVTSTITVNEADSLSSVISTINNNSTANVNAFLDSTTGRLSLSSKTTGGGTGITVSGDFLANFDLTSSHTGSDAQLTINGLATTRKTNTFTENGVEITLNATTASTGGTASTITVNSNVDKIVDTIKSFIKDYNDIFDTVNKKLNEERYRSFTPLTSEQKEDMKESEIELWEGKAKSGLLRRDSTLTSLVSNMRLASVTSVTVDGQAVHMNDLGIATGQWQDRGKLVIQDEAKLRAAIEADPDKVMAYFTQQTTSTDPTVKTSPTNPDNGLFNRLSNSLSTALDELAKKAGTSRYSTDSTTAFIASSSMGEQLRSLDLRISDMARRMTIIETNYYKQFTAMETAMNRYSAQSSSLFGS